MNRDKHFLTEGVIQDEFLHILYESEVHDENVFIFIVYVSEKF